MFKTKLFAIICAAASAVTVAVTTLTLFIAGPAKVKTIYNLSPNEAVATTIQGVFSSASSSASNITQIFSAMANSKTATNVGFKINYIKGYEELSNIEGNAEIQLDPESMAAALLLDASYGSLSLDGTVYIDKNELLASAPSLFDGVIRLGLEDLEYNLENSIIGEFLSYSDIRDIEEVYTLIMEEYETLTPQFDFDSEAFMEGLTETMEKSFQKAMKNTKVDDLGKQKLNGGKYQGYKAKFPVDDLSNIIRDAVVYCLESPEFEDIYEQVSDYTEELTGNDLEYYFGMDASTLSQYSSLVSSMWPSITSELEKIIGDNITMTLYISDTAELAGLEIGVYVLDDSISFDKSDASKADFAVEVNLDYTGGKNIGDYSEISVVMTEDNDDTLSILYSNKTKDNGDFDLAFKMDENNKNSIEVTANGNYVSNGTFFSLDVDSLKFKEDGDTIIDVGFKLGINEITSVTKPSGTPVYDILEMDYYDFYSLYLELEDTLEEVIELFD